MKRIMSCETYKALRLNKVNYAFICNNYMKIINIKTSELVFISPRIKNIIDVVYISDELLLCVNTTGKSVLLNIVTGEIIKNFNLGPELYNLHFAVFSDSLWYLNKDWQVYSLDLKTFFRKPLNMEICFGFYDYGKQIYFVFYDKFVRSAVDSKMRLMRFSKNNNAFDKWVIHLPKGCIDSFTKVDERRAVVVMEHPYMGGVKNSVYIIDLYSSEMKKIIDEKGLDIIMGKVEVCLKMEIIFYYADNKMVLFDIQNLQIISKFFFNVSINDLKVIFDKRIMLCTNKGVYSFDLNSFVNGVKSSWKYIEL